MTKTPKPESKELQRLREDTNLKPAPQPEEAPPPTCPQCGAELDRDTLECVNPAHDDYA